MGNIDRMGEKRNSYRILIYDNLWKTASWEAYLNTDIHIKIQGDQKVSVHLMITTQEVTSNVQSVPPPVSRHLLTRRNVFSKTVFSIVMSTFRMYSVQNIVFLRVFLL